MREVLILGEGKLEELRDFSQKRRLLLKGLGVVFLTGGSSLLAACEDKESASREFTPGDSIDYSLPFLFDQRDQITAQEFEIQFDLILASGGFKNVVAPLVRDRWQIDSSLRFTSENDEIALLYRESKFIDGGFQTQQRFVDIEESMIPREGFLQAYRKTLYLFDLYGRVSKSGYIISWAGGDQLPVDETFRESVTDAELLGLAKKLTDAYNWWKANGKPQ